MGQRTKGTKGRYLVHAGRDFTKSVPGWGPFNDKSYKKGQIIDNQSSIRAMKTDMRTKAVHKVKPRYGHLGDLMKVKKRRRDGVVQTYRIRDVERLLPEAERLDALEARKNVLQGANDGHYAGKCAVCKKNHAVAMMHYLGSDRRIAEGPRGHLAVCSNKCGLVLYEKGYRACGCGG